MYSPPHLLQCWGVGTVVLAPDGGLQAGEREITILFPEHRHRKRVLCVVPFPRELLHNSPAPTPDLKGGRNLAPDTTADRKASESFALGTDGGDRGRSGG